MKEPPVLRGPKIRTAGPPPVALVPASRLSQLLNSRAAILGLLFCVTGFLGIPFLWKSPKFSRTEKIVWSVVVTIYTLALIAIAAAICWWSYTQISQLLA